MTGSSRGSSSRDSREDKGIDIWEMWEGGRVIEA
jgi:hypothetical protein